MHASPAWSVAAATRPTTAWKSLPSRWPSGSLTTGGAYAGSQRPTVTSTRSGDSHITCRLSGPDTIGPMCRSGRRFASWGRRSRRRQQPQAFPEVRRKAQIGLRPILNHRRRHRPFRSSCPRKCRRRLRRARHRIPPIAIRAHRTLGRGMAQARSHAWVRSRRCPGWSRGPLGSSIGTIRLGAAPRGGTRPSGQAGTRSAGQLHPCGQVFQRPGSFSVPRRNDCRPDIHRPDSFLPPCLLGVDAANQMRDRLGAPPGPIRNPRLSEIVGTNVDHLQTKRRSTFSIPYALRLREETGSRLALRSARSHTRRFELCRSLGDIMWSRNDDMGPLSAARSERQKFQRVPAYARRPEWNGAGRAQGARRSTPPLDRKLGRDRVPRSSVRRSGRRARRDRCIPRACPASRHALRTAPLSASGHHTRQRTRCRSSASPPSRVQHDATPQRPPKRPPARAPRSRTGVQPRCLPGRSSPRRPA